MFKDLGPVEVGDDLSTIKANRHNWTHASEYWPKCIGTPMYFFGSPVYTGGDYIGLRVRSEGALSQIRLLSAVSSRLATFFNRPVEHLSGSSLPGFHIFTGKGLVSSQFHVDADYLDRFPTCGFHLGMIYSFVVPLQLPAAGSGLDTKVGHIPYTVDHLFVWRASIPHKIPDIDLLEGESRITYQGHFILQPDKLLYYW
jgi:hypothetical protein